MQYNFTKGKRTLQPQSHGNSKSGKAFLPTQKSTKEEIKKLSQASRPKEVFHRIIEEKGGVRHLSFPGEHARSYQQVSDYRRSVTGHSKTSKAPDAVVELMQMCKVESRDPCTAFVRRMHSSPELQVILCTNRQLKELEQICTNPELFSPLSLDVTFNMGDVYVAVTTYRNLLLKTKNNCHPVMIGPIMLHQQRLYESYYALASSVVQLSPKLKNILCYETDEEKNLYKAFGTVFPFAIHLLCDIHMEDNIMRKVIDLGIQKSLADEYKKEIFGRRSGTVREPGLVDCLTEQDFQHRLNLLRPVWDKRHVKGRQFYEYFARQATGQLSAGQQTAGHHGQAPASQHGEQPVGHHAQQAATGQQLAGQQPVGQHAQEAARQQPTGEQATTQASGKKPSPSSGAFVLTSLYFCNSRVSVCYSSNQKLREPPAIPRPPLDLVIVGKMRRKYMQEGEKKIGKESNVYFHPLRECVNKRAPMFIPSLLTFHPTGIRETFFVQDHNDFIRDKLGI